MVWDRKTTARITRHRIRIRRLRIVEGKMRSAINEHRELEPMQCDVDFMGGDYLEKRRQYRDRHERLLQAYAELTCERMAMQEINEEIYATKKEDK